MIVPGGTPSVIPLRVASRTGRPPTVTVGADDPGRVETTIVHGFDYTALHWADKQKPLEEVAGSFGVFPETLRAPPLVPEAVDEEAPTEVSAEQVSGEPAGNIPLLKRLAMYRPRRRGRARERAA